MAGQALSGRVRAESLTGVIEVRSGVDVLLAFVMACAGVSELGHGEAREPKGVGDFWAVSTLLSAGQVVQWQYKVNYNRWRRGQ